MTTAFQSDAFQATGFQIESGANFALAATDGADLAAATVSLSLAGLSFSLAAAEGADTFAGAVSSPYSVGKPLSWVILPARVYTQKMAAKSIPRLPSRVRTLKQN